MITIPACEFMMGTPERVLDWIASQQPYDRSWFEDESPQHPVSLPAFLIDRHPVTNAEFAVFASESAYRSVAERRGFGWVYADYWQEVAGASWNGPDRVTPSMTPHGRTTKSSKPWRGATQPSAASRSTPARA